MVEATITGDAAKPNGSGGADIKPEGGNPQPPRIGGFELHSPSDILGSGTGSGGGEPARKRGRPKGSTNRPVEKTQNNLIANLESLLLSVHFMGATILEMPEIELDAQEATMLSDSLRKVAEFYPVSLSPKRMAMAELMICLGTIYGPRIITIYKKAPKGPKLVPPKPAQPQTTQPQPAQPAAASAGSRPLTQATSGPRVPSEMWNQDGFENATDQA